MLGYFDEQEWGDMQLWDEDHNLEPIHEIEEDEETDS